MQIQIPLCRKTFGSFLLLIIALLAFPFRGMAQSVVQNGMRFSVVGESLVEVSASGDNLPEALIIPSSVSIGGKDYQVTSIAPMGFKGTDIVGVVLPQGLYYLGDYAFSECHRLRSVFIPKSVAYISSLGFSFSENLERLIVEEGNANFHNVGLAVVDNDDILITYPGKGEERLVLSGDIKGIKECALFGCHGIKEIVIPSTVTQVGSYALSACSQLERVIWNSPADVPNYCFYYSSSLCEVYLSDQVGSIDYNAFTDTNLQTLTLSNPTPCLLHNYEGKTPFSDAQYQNTIVYVPEGSLAAYQTADGWKNFKNIKEVQNATWRRSLIVETLDGATMEYLLDKNTKVRIEQPNLVIETDGSVLTYELESMSQIRYGRKYITTGIYGETIVNGQSFRMEDGILLFDNLRDNTPIEIYTVDGKMVSSRRGSGNTQVSLGQFGSGVYFVKVNGETYKILKK